MFFEIEEKKNEKINILLTTIKTYGFALPKNDQPSECGAVVGFSDKNESPLFRILWIKPSIWHDVLISNLIMNFRFLNFSVLHNKKRTWIEKMKQKEHFNIIQQPCHPNLLFWLDFDVRWNGTFSGFPSPNTWHQFFVFVFSSKTQMTFRTVFWMILWLHCWRNVRKKFETVYNRCLFIWNSFFFFIFFVNQRLQYASIKSFTTQQY